MSNLVESSSIFLDKNRQSHQLRIRMGRKVHMFQEKGDSRKYSSETVEEGLPSSVKVSHVITNYTEARAVCFPSHAPLPGGQYRVGGELDLTKAGV